MKKVAVFGTFDILHPGHINFLKQAKSLGQYLLVIVARDKFVQQAKTAPPINNEQKRLSTLRRANLMDKAILGSKTHNYFRTLRSNAITTIALGYDQKPSIPILKKELKIHRLKNIAVKRLRAFKPNLFKSSIIKLNEMRLNAE